MKNKKDIISQVNANIRKEHSASINQDSLYSRGVAWEGYDGGYMQALSDVLLFMNGVIPNSRYEHIWREVIEESEKKLFKGKIWDVHVDNFLREK